MTPSLTPNQGPRDGLSGPQAASTPASEAQDVRDAPSAPEGRTAASRAEFRQQIADAIKVAAEEWVKAIFQPDPPHATMYDLAAEHVLHVVDARLARVRQLADKLDAIADTTASVNDRRLYQALARDLRRRLDGDKEG